MEVDLGAIAYIAEESSFSGVVRVDRHGDVVLLAAFGEADRAHGIANTPTTRFAIASGTKTFTALVVVSLVEDGVLRVDTPARDLLGADLPLIADDVTIEHLLAHWSGIGDYFDEDATPDITDYVLPVPPHRLATAEDYLAVLDGFPTVFRAGERFAYNNGGYVVLALLAERAAGVPYPELVAERVCRRAGMTATAFLRSDELPGDAALGYLWADGLRTNLLHLPLRGVGDGGLYSTAADIHALWDAFFAGRIVSESWVAEMTRPRSRAADGPFRYGLGFWLHPTGAAAMLEGYDAGISFRSACDPTSRVLHTVLSNTSEGAWPMARHLADAADGTSGGP